MKLSKRFVAGIALAGIALAYLLQTDSRRETSDHETAGQSVE